MANLFQRLFRRKPSLAMPPMPSKLDAQMRATTEMEWKEAQWQKEAAEMKAYHAAKRAEAQQHEERNAWADELVQTQAEIALIRACLDWRPSDDTAPGMHVDGNHRAAVAQLVRDADAQIAFCADDLPLMPDIAEPHPEWWSHIQADLRQRATVNPLPQRVCMEHLKQYPQDASITLTIFAPHAWGNGNDIIELAKARLLAAVASALAIQAVEQCVVTWKRVASDPAWTLVIWHKGDRKTEVA